MLTCFTLLWAAGANAWPGFQYETWLEISQAKKPEVTSPQSGLPDLLPLLAKSADSDARIESTEEWEQKRAAILDALAPFVGTPTDLKLSKEPVQVGEKTDEEGYTRTHLLIPGEVDDPIPAYLLTPDTPIATPTPVMIVLHQTQAPGKQEACGMVGNPDMAFAKELAQRGYICIAPDAVGFGERIPEGEQPYYGANDVFRRHPNWSFFGKMNWDVSRVVDYIETLPEVDKARIGVMGHSHGAYGSIFATIYEPRIALAVASCGFNTLRKDPRPERWSHLTALLPPLGFYVDDIAEAPFDWHEIAACIAPRPYFNWATLNDSIFPNTENLTDIYMQLGGVYALYDAGDRFSGYLATGAHRFPIEAHEIAYTWIDRQFGL